MSGTDIGPGMCLIDKWVSDKSKKIMMKME